MEELQFAGGSCSTTPSVVGAAITVTCSALIAPLRLLVWSGVGALDRILFDTQSYRNQSEVTKILCTVS